MERALKTGMVWCVSVIGHPCLMCALSTAWQQLFCKPCLLEAIHMENHLTASRSYHCIQPYSCIPHTAPGCRGTVSVVPPVPKLTGFGEPCTGESQPRWLRSKTHPPPTSILHLQRRVWEDTDPGAAAISHCSGEGAEGWRWEHSHC